MKKIKCEHIRNINVKELKLDMTGKCAECVKLGTNWVHLRVCQTCGETLCCDDSPYKHMTAHYHGTKHPVMISAEEGEKWMWCFEDNMGSVYR